MLHSIARVLLSCMVVISLAMPTYGQDVVEDQGHIVSGYVCGLRSSDWTVRRDAAEALGQMGEDAVAAIPDLVNALGDAEAYVRASVARALGKIGVQGVPGLIRALQDQDAGVRKDAARGLERIGAGAEAAIPLLILALNDENKDVKIAAADALGAIGPAAREAIPDLALLLGDPDITVGWPARRALTRLGSVSPIADLLAVLRDEASSADRRLKACRALGYVGRSNMDELVSALVVALRDDDGRVRAAAADNLGRVGANSDEAVAALIGALDDSDRGVRLAAAKALRDTRTVFAPEVEKRISDAEKGGIEEMLEGLDMEMVKGVISDFELPSRAIEVTSPVIDLRPGDSIQAAIDGLAGQGGVVHLSAGTYEVDSTILVTSNLVLCGDGPDRTVVTISKGAKHEELLSGRGSIIGNVVGGIHDLVIRDLMVDGGLDRSERHWIDGVNSSQAWPGGVYILDQGGKRNCRVLISNVTITRTAMGFHSKGTDDLIITDCRFYDNGGVVNYFHNAYLRRNERVLVTNSTFADSHTGNGLNLTLQRNTIVKDSVFSGNHFRGVRAANTQNLVIVNNTATNNGAFGIGTRNEDGGVSKYVIAGNHTSGNATGIDVVSATNGVIFDNLVEDGYSGTASVKH